MLYVNKNVFYTHNYIYQIFIFKSLNEITMNFI